jgi:hypothetical protein
MHRFVPTKQVQYLAVIIAIAASLFMLASGSAQPTQALNEDWISTDYNFTSRMMDTDLNDNVVILGDTVVGDYLVIKKFNAAGSLLWQTTYDPTERLRGVWVAVDSGGNILSLATVVGGSNYTPSGWVILKYDPNGNLLWVNNLPGPFRDARRVEVDGSDQIYVAGRMWLTNASSNTTQDSVLIKYSPDGTMLWTSVFDNSSAIDEPYAMTISPDSSRIGVAGVSGNLFMGLMYDPNGNLLWSKTSGVGYPANDVAFDTGNNSYFATGTYFPQDPNPYQMAVAKFNAAGNLSWLKSYPVGDRAFRVGLDFQGNILVTGIDQVGYVDWMTIKTDANGNLVWSRRYDGGRNNDENPNMLAIDASGAVYITGTGGPNPSSGTISYLKGVVAKYGPDGTPQWAVWDPYAGGKALRLGPGDTLSTLGFGYLVTAHYTQTGLADLPPASPTSLTGTASATGSSGGVNLYFVDNASNEFWVEAERCTGSACTDFTRVAQSRGEDATGLSDSGLSRGVVYTYRVRAVGFVGPSGYSNTVEVMVPPVNPPTAPGNLAAAMDGSYVVLTWQDNSTNESQFYVERCQGAGCTTFAGTGSSNANVTTWTDYNAAGGLSFSYRVRAWNPDGYSSYSNTVTVVTPGGPPPASPPAPSNLSASPLNNSQIKLTWTNNTPNQDGVKIERCLGSKCTNFVQVTIVAGNATSYTDAGLAANTAYRYRVAAYNTSGVSPYSNTASARTAKR